MPGSTVLEIIIILVFIYLIYSLLTTIVVEIISSILRLRSRNLRNSIGRMLQDSKSQPVYKGWFEHMYWSVVKLFNRKAGERSLVRLFFERPAIKYLGRNNLNTTPSYIEAGVFSQTLLDILRRETGANDLESVKTALAYDESFDKPILLESHEWEQLEKELHDRSDPENVLEEFLNQFDPVEPGEKTTFTEREIEILRAKMDRLADIKEKKETLDQWRKALNEDKIIIEPETRLHLSLLLKESGEDLNRFRELLEEWFNQTMDRAKGWYKKKMAFLSFFTGLVVAVSFNVDTIFITRELKNDLSIREALMAQVEAYSNSGQGIEMSDALSDSVSANASRINETLSLSTYHNFTGSSPLRAVTGWLLTALALSFGAPFWFDLLNKLMKLRTSVPVQQSGDEKKGKPGDSGSGSMHKVPGINPKG